MSLREAFALQTRVGWAVGLITTEKARHGGMVWVSREVFSARPTSDQVAQIREWRWPIVLTVNTMRSQKRLDSLGEYQIPQGLSSMPIMRSMGLKRGWVKGEFVDGDLGRTRMLGPTDDRSLPVLMIVNDNQLREMIESGWEPEDRW